MYHCHVHFYLTGLAEKAFEIIKEMTPLGNFTHEFLESGQPDAALAARADVIFAYLTGKDAEKDLEMLLSAKSREAQLVLLADREAVPALAEDLWEVKDLWSMPMESQEIRFRFLKWQQAYKTEKDLWQTSHYLEATINKIGRAHV